MLLAAGLAGLWLVWPGLAAAQPESWPGLQGGPAHLGAASGAAAPPLKVAWRSGPGGNLAVGSVAVVPGLTVAVAKTRVIGIDPAKGEVLWKVDRASGALSTPVIAPGLGPNGIVVFTEGDRQATSALVGVDLSTRDRLWSVRLGDLVRGSPTLAGSRAYVGARDGLVYAVDAATGRLAWKTRTSGSVDATPAVSDGMVFVASEDEAKGNVTLWALDASTGRSRWNYLQSAAALGPSSPTVAGGVVYVGFGDLRVRAFDARSGRLLWATLVRAAFSFESALAWAGGSLYVLDDAGGVYRLDAGSGHRVWEYRFPADVASSSPLVTDGYAFVGMDDGTVAAIDVGRGHLVWRAGIGGRVGALAPSGGLLLAPLADGRGGVVALEHDPAGALIDEPSPTQLDLAAALANFAGAFLVLTPVLLALFRFALRPRRNGQGRTDGSEAATPE